MVLKNRITMKISHKKAIMGVGVLLIFISTILTAAIAAGVLIRTSGVLQIKAVEVERISRERLTSGLEFVKVVGYANVTTGTMSELEIITRLKTGSSPVDLEYAYLSYVEDTFITQASINYTAANYSCEFANLTPETEYCFEYIFGNGNPDIEEEELVYIRFKLNDSHAMQSNDNFELQLIPKVGELTQINLRVPSIKVYKVDLY